MLPPAANRPRFPEPSAFIVPNPRGGHNTQTTPVPWFPNVALIDVPFPIWTPRFGARRALLPVGYLRDRGLLRILVRRLRYGRFPRASLDAPSGCLHVFGKAPGCSRGRLGNS